MNKKFEKLGFYPADIMLPANADMSRWSVVACDQFTSQPEYWEEVERIAGDEPSTLRLILPEAGLNKPGVEDDIAKVNDNINLGKRVCVIAKNADKYDFDTELVFDAGKNDFDYAARLFYLLRTADEKGADTVLAEMPGNTGIGIALFNRLNKSSAGRVIY